MWSREYTTTEAILEYLQDCETMGCLSDDLNQLIHESIVELEANNPLIDWVRINKKMASYKSILQSIDSAVIHTQYNTMIKERCEKVSKGLKSPKKGVKKSEGRFVAYLNRMMIEKGMTEEEVLKAKTDQYELGQVIDDDISIESAVRSINNHKKTVLDSNKIAKEARAYIDAVDAMNQTRKG